MSHKLRTKHNKSMQPTAERRRLLVGSPAAADLNSYASTPKEQMETSITPLNAKKLEVHLCVKLGFCSMREKFHRIVESLPMDLSKTVDEIFLAEGLVPESADRKLWRQVRDMVVQAHHDGNNTTQNRLLQLTRDSLSPVPFYLLQAAELNR